MVQRKSEKAANTWFKIAQPLITKGEKAGQRDTPRITVTVQVIPDTAFDGFGHRKLTGFTLAELEKCYKTGEPLQIKDREDRILARVEIGGEYNQLTKEELKQIIDETKRSGLLLSASPMDQIDLERTGKAAARTEGAKRARQSADTARSGDSGETD